MRKVKVNCTVSYTYEAELPDDVNVNDGEDVCIAVDGQDPLYQALGKIMQESKISEPFGEISSIFDSETGELLYAL